MQVASGDAFKSGVSSASADVLLVLDDEWRRSTSTVLRRLIITMDGDRLLRMVETDQDG